MAHDSRGNHIDFRQTAEAPTLVKNFGHLSFLVPALTIPFTEWGWMVTIAWISIWGILKYMDMTLLAALKRLQVWCQGPIRTSWRKSMARRFRNQ